MAEPICSFKGQAISTLNWESFQAGIARLGDNKSLTHKVGESGYLQFERGRNRQNDPVYILTNGVFSKDKKSFLEENIKIDAQGCIYDAYQNRINKSSPEEDHITRPEEAQIQAVIVRANQLINQVGDPKLAFTHSSGPMTY